MSRSLSSWLRTVLAGRTAHLWGERWSWSSVVLCVLVLLVRFHQIDTSLPYTRHVDERPLVEAALRVLQTETRNPKFFNYGSLPIYAASAGLAFGAIRAAQDQELEKLEDIDRVRPYYSHPRVFGTARKVFAAAAVLGMWLTGILAARTFKIPSLRLLTPALLLLPRSYTRLSWEYLNVDIWAAVLSLATLAWLMSTWKTRGVVSKALMPAALAAAATASKYNAATIAVPCIIAILLDERPASRMPRVLQFVGFFGVFFVLFVPYSVLDTSSFLDGVLFEARHYARGHGTSTVEAGWPHLSGILALLPRRYGWPLVVLMAVGICFTIRLHWRRGAVLLSAIATSLLLMSGQRVFFERNYLALLVQVVPFAALGTIVAIRYSSRALARRFPAGEPLLKVTLAFALLLVIVGSVGPSDVLAAQRTQEDSRALARTWLAEHVREGHRIVIDKALQGDWNQLKGDTWREQALAKPIDGSLLPAYVVLAVDGPGKLNLPRPEKAKLVAEFGTRTWRGPFSIDPKLRIYRVEP